MSADISAVGSKQESRLTPASPQVNVSEGVVEKVRRLLVSARDSEAVHNLMLGAGVGLLLGAFRGVIALPGPLKSLLGGGSFRTRKVPLSVLGSVALASIKQELLWRGCVQGVLLNQLPRFCIKKFAPAKEQILDSDLCKTARSALCMSKDNGLEKALVSCICGQMKEDSPGLLGAIGMRLAYNVTKASLPSLGIGMTW